MQKIKSSLTDHLRNCTKEMMKELNVPGAAVAIVKDGKIVLSEGFGYRDVEHKNPLHLARCLQLAHLQKLLVPFL